MHGWDNVDQDRLFTMILPFLKEQLGRCKSEMPGMYAETLADIHPHSIRTQEDWYRVPLCVKDTNKENGLRGFRETVNANPRLLKPNDINSPVVTFGSGGTLGKYTPTFITVHDREREVEAFGRSIKYHGIAAGDTAISTYNLTHKGGQWIQESLVALGVNVLLRRPEEGPDKILENIRDYKANVLFTVQQPIENMDKQAKSAGINLHDLVEKSLENPQHEGILVPDKDGQRQIEFVFLGGFEIVPYALDLARNYLGDIPIATCLGSSEAIPQACSTNPALTSQAQCHHNNLHLLNGPHYIEVVKKDKDSWKPVDKGEEGYLIYTSFARDGTIWMRYWPGDVATLALKEGECSCGLFSPVITNVHRANASEQNALLFNGCAQG